MSARSFGLPDDLRGYLLANGVREPAAARDLRAAIGRLDQSGWEISPEQAQLMTLLAEILGARRFLEVGTFAGYCTLWMALALPADGEVVTCDLDDAFPSVGRPFWERAGVADKITLRTGPALASLDALIADGRAGDFDMAFIDADKKPYPDYYERCLTLVRTGGLVMLDNVFWGGNVVDPSDGRKSTAAIRAVSERIATDRRVHVAMVPVGDGFTIARKVA
jgi:predicted O-methyltransferase YrrM